MAIFDNNFLFESSTAAEEFTVEADMSVEATMESVVEMNAELNEGVYKLNTSLYIADLVMEQSGQTALLEASLGDFWEKTKKKFKEIWEKIKGFFKNLLRKMDVMFQGSEKFIKKYEKVIKSITTKKDAKYEIFNETAGTYHLDPKEMTKMMGGGQMGAGFANDVANFDIAITGMDTAIREAVNLKANKKEVDDIKNKIKELEGGVYRKVSNASSDAQGVKKEFKRMLRQKSNHVKNIADKQMILDMLTYCTGWIKEGKKNVIRSQSSMDKALGSCIKQIDKFKQSQEAAAKNNESLMSLVTEGVNAMNRMIGVANYINGVSFDTFNGCFRTYVGMLKTFVSKNSKLVKGDMIKKESATDSILDSIMGSF